MTPAEYRAMRNTLNAKAREADDACNRAVAERCQTMAKNFLAMASDDPSVRERGARMLKKNERHWKEFTTHGVRRPE
jgi:hypothetical protein